MTRSDNYRHCLSPHGFYTQPRGPVLPYCVFRHSTSPVSLFHNRYSTIALTVEKQSTNLWDAGLLWNDLRKIVAARHRTERIFVP